MLGQRSDQLHRLAPELHRHRAPARRSPDHRCLGRPGCAGDRNCSKQIINGVFQRNGLTYDVSKPHLRFADIFPKRLGIFSPNFTRLLHVPIYARLQIFVQLFATPTKLCNIKRDHPVDIMHAQDVHRQPKRTLGGRT